MGLRQERMGDEIRDLIASALMGGKMADPGLELVTITAVKLTPDLQLASVYFRTMPGVNSKETLAGLKRASGFFRSIIAKQIDVRKAPALRFFYDESVEYGSHIEGLLKKIHDSDPNF